MTESMDDRWASLSGMPNGIVPLEQTTAELLIAGVNTSLSASIVLRLSNEPGLLVQLNGPSPPLFGRSFGERLRFPTENYELKGFIKNWSWSEGNVKAVFVPSIEPMQRVFRKRLQLARIHFRVINFPEFFGQQDARNVEEQNTSYRLGCAVLSAQQWMIRITALPDLKQTVETLKRDGGYGLTHSGRSSPKTAGKSGLRLYG